MIAHMEQKYRMLEVGEVIEAGDEVMRGCVWQKTADAGRIVVVRDLPRRRPVSEVNIHGSSENSTGKVVTDAIPQDYRLLSVGEVIQPGDQCCAQGKWIPTTETTWGASIVNMGHREEVFRNMGYYRRPVAATPKSSTEIALELSEKHYYQKVAEITEVREAWQKDHMGMKRKLDAAEKEVLRYENLWTENCNHVREVEAKLEAQTRAKDAAVAERMDIERMWQKQRAELADARNKITDLQKSLERAQTNNRHLFKVDEEKESLRKMLNDVNSESQNLTRRLEDAMSEKVIAEKSYHEARVERDQAVKDLGGTTTMLMKANSENHDLKINLDNAMRSMVSDEAKFADKNATICRLKEKLKNLEHHVENEHVASWRKIQQVLPESVRNLDLSLVDQVVKCITDLGKVDNAAQNWQDIKVSKNGETHALGTLIPLLESQIASMEDRISEHHKEADRLTRQNEELSKASYQLNTIKQAFQFIKES